MKYKSYLLFIIILFYGCINTNYMYLHASEKKDAINEIIKYTEGTVIEYGLNVHLTAADCNEAECIKLINGIGCSSDSINKVQLTGKSYCIEFENNMETGYLEYNGDDSQKSITFQVIIKDNKNGLESLKNKVKRSSLFCNKKINYIQYIKLKLNNIRSNDETNTGIINLLKKDNAESIETIRLKNGYSSTAYTGLYNTVSDKGQLIDLNFSVCNYSTGNYVIVGTPEIMTTY